MDSIHATETLPKCAYYCFICNANMDKCVFMLIGWIIGISKIELLLNDTQILL